MVRPKDTPRSWVVKWKGNKPVLEQSNWAPGYTTGHQETEQQAIAMEIAHLLQNISDFREKWLNINLLAEQTKHAGVADAFGSVVGVSVTETDDPHEAMTMPEGYHDVTQGIPDEALASMTIHDPAENTLFDDDFVDYGGWEDH